MNSIFGNLILFKNIYMKSMSRKYLWIVKYWFKYPKLIYPTSDTCFFGTNRSKNHNKKSHLLNQKQFVNFNFHKFAFAIRKRINFENDFLWRTGILRIEINIVDVHNSKIDREIFALSFSPTLFCLSTPLQYSKINFCVLRPGITGFKKTLTHASRSSFNVRPGPTPETHSLGEMPEWISRLEE